MLTPQLSNDNNPPWFIFHTRLKYGSVLASHRIWVVRGSMHLKFPAYVSLPCVSPWRRNIPGGRHPSSDPQSGRASLHPPAGFRRLSGFSDLRFMSGAEGRSSSSQLPEHQPSRAGLDGGLINLCVFSWPTCPSPGGTAAPAAKRSSQDTTHTASAPAGCSARPTRSCECATVGWCTCPVRSRTRAQLGRCYRVAHTHNRDSSSLLSVGLAPLNNPSAQLSDPLGVILGRHMFDFDYWHLFHGNLQQWWGLSGQPVLRLKDFSL